MVFGEKSEMRKKSKEIKNDLKQLRKDMISKGADKVQVEEWLREWKDCVESAGKLHSTYEVAVEHQEIAREAIGTLLAYMGESPLDKVKESFHILAEDLDLIYHDSSLRKDDMDLMSTITCLKKMMTEYTGESAIMLRSELENLKAVLDDASTWTAPDFMALAYYFLHESKESLSDMENEQKNLYIVKYYNENFWNDFSKELKRAELLSQAEAIIKTYV